ncbi:DUF4424 family protein [Aestuariivirga sp.]|uniref:DUF4424 family protein n=1 Tax=Aestuariivirga sp. TaxID=2650926 RepID=UPI0039E65E37
MTSIATLGAGGLVLVRADTVTMVKEDLFISPSKVSVDYVFRNNADEAKTYLVAFPMPDIEPDNYLNSDISIPEPEKENYMNFAVSADGKDVVPKIEMRALSATLDVTDKLTALGIPLNPLSDETAKTLKAVPADKLKELVTLGAIVTDDDGPRPAWTLRSTYYWEQTFPAKAEIKVHHNYTPAVGATFFYESALKEQNVGRDYCVDQSTAAAIHKAIVKGGADNPYLNQRTLEYILTTGANWQGSIEDFHLTVDKESPDTIISFCGDGVKKTGPTQFEMRKKDFYPTDEFRLLLLSPMQP